MIRGTYRYIYICLLVLIEWYMYTKMFISHLASCAKSCLSVPPRMVCGQGHCCGRLLAITLPLLVCSRWIEACIEDELPPTTELEEALRNGVILCRLGHYYCPELLPLRRIYDLEQTKYRVRTGRKCF